MESIKHFVRLCDLFSYYPFTREVKLNSRLPSQDNFDILALLSND
jgi:hypothetical protein